MSFMPNNPPLTAEDLATADRLRRAWNAYKAARKEKGDPINQTVMAENLGFKNQSGFSGYLRGSHPINLEFLVKFCTITGDSIEKISPKHAKMIDKMLNRHVESFPTKYHALSSAQQKAVEDLVHALSMSSD